MSKNKSCPTTKFYESMIEKFKTGFSKSAEAHKCRVSNFLGRISEKTYKKLQKDEKSQEELGRGLKEEISIMFADIRGFTSRTETMEPDRIITLLDLFIPEMLHIIINRHSGMVDKLLGDGIMALYGHPFDSSEKTSQALLAATDMQQAASAMGTVLEFMDYAPIQIGVGINTGEVLICEVGSNNYRETTVIGSPVNLAAKMEDVAGAGEIVIPEGAAQKLDQENSGLVQFLSEKPEKRYDQKVFDFNWIQYLERTA